MGGVRQKGNESFPNSSVFKRKIKWSSSCLLFAPCPCLGGVSLCELLGLGLRPGCGSGCRLDSSDFTQGSVSPRGDREMSASVSLCLSSKPCQRQLSSHSITTLSLRVSLCFTIRDAQTVQARRPPPHHHPDSSTVLMAYVTTHTRSRCLSCFGVWLWECMRECHVIVCVGAWKPGMSPCLDVLSDSVSEVNPVGGSL